MTANSDEVFVWVDDEVRNQEKEEMDKMIKLRENLKKLFDKKNKKSQKLNQYATYSTSVSNMGNDLLFSYDCHYGNISRIAKKVQALSISEIADANSAKAVSALCSEKYKKQINSQNRLLTAQEENEFQRIKASLKLSKDELALKRKSAKELEAQKEILEAQTLPRKKEIEEYQQYQEWVLLNDEYEGLKLQLEARQQMMQQEQMSMPRRVPVRKMQAPHQARTVRPMFAQEPTESRRENDDVDNFQFNERPKPSESGLKPKVFPARVSKIRGRRL